MKYAVALEWAEDLRKNYKKKTTTTLKEENKEKYCCLGRLCVVLGHKFDQDGYVLDKRGRRYADGTGVYQNTVLPRAIMKEAGMKSSTGQIKSIDAELTDLNDGGKGFKYIATKIEKHWREL